MSESQTKNLMTKTDKGTSGELDKDKNRKNTKSCCYKWWHNNNTICFTIVGTIFLTSVISLLTFLIVRMYMPTNQPIQNETNSSLAAEIKKYELTTLSGNVLNPTIGENESENDDDEAGENEEDNALSTLKKEESEDVIIEKEKESENKESNSSKENEESKGKKTSPEDAITSTSGASKLVGRWDLINSVNFEEYMEEMGVGFFTRKIGASTKPVNIISRNGDEWILRIESTFKNSETKFTDGVEFTEETLDGRKCKSVITTDGPNKLVQVQKDGKTGKVVSTITREIDDKDQLIIKLTADTVTSIRTYKRS